jgi:hypothetical protein
MGAWKDCGRPFLPPVGPVVPKGIVPRHSPSRARGTKNQFVNGQKFRISQSRIWRCSTRMHGLAAVLPIGRLGHQGLQMEIRASWAQVCACAAHLNCALPRLCQSAHQRKSRRSSITADKSSPMIDLDVALEQVNPQPSKFPRASILIPTLKSGWLCLQGPASGPDGAGSVSRPVVTCSRVPRLLRSSASRNCSRWTRCARLNDSPQANHVTGT